MQVFIATREVTCNEIISFSASLTADKLKIGIKVILLLVIEIRQVNIRNRSKSICVAILSDSN